MLDKPSFISALSKSLDAKLLTDEFVKGCWNILEYSLGSGKIPVADIIFSQREIIYTQALICAGLVELKSGFYIPTVVAREIDDVF